MKNLSLFLRGLIQAIIAVAYIVLVVSIMSQKQKWVGPNPEVITGTLMLLLFVVSAAVMALVVFGTPVIWYIDGKKKEAIRLVLYTIGSLAGILIIAFIFAGFLF